MIDSIKKTTLLDKEATIAQGNLSKQRDSLLIYVSKQERLIDSLRKESNNYKTIADTLKSAFNNLKFALREKDIQIRSKEETQLLNQKIFQADLNALRRKRLGLGLSIGYGLTNEGQSMFAGLGITYTFIRL